MQPTLRKLHDCFTPLTAILAASGLQRATRAVRLAEQLEYQRHRDATIDPFMHLLKVSCLPNVSKQKEIMRYTQSCFAVIFLAAMITVAGCQPQPVAQQPASKRWTLTMTPELEGKLKAADHLDGHDDLVIENCYVCALGMKGKKELSATVENYELYFCSEACCNEMGKDPAKVISETAIPTQK